MKRHIPNILTCTNLVVGALGCISIIKGDLWNAIYFVIVAAAFDFFDGFAARLLNVKSELGKELDSLADMISFGLLPAIYLQAALAKTGIDPLILSYVPILIAPFSALRLAKFNLDTRQADQFIGLPTPANAIMITSMGFLPNGLESWQLIVLAIASCILLVSNIPMLALKFSSFGFKENLWRYLLIIMSLALILILGKSGVVYIIPTYIIVSILGNFISKKSV
ncbi:CDP-diacylglycerol--serine O-phosphatidyltransferase [Marinoscillum sp. MHG1-6]|uniref:CDP-diacylglycerol--serine O-phosphatidyltransferase n=1 Tax=Marinoscillum sp. MHG1-6 TaxID=2959627 RepID=UPI00215844DE|nr:CDP-diacylglycerol--serine O-phosphatidyltransferase [Marinoscillum sp. MHG1-6]